MKGKQMVTFEWLLKMDLLIICLSLFFPSFLTCTDFALPYREYFMLLLSLIGAFGWVVLQNKEKVVCVNRIDFWIIVFFLYMLVDFRCFNVEYCGKIITGLLAYLAFRNVSIKFLYVCFVLIVFSALIQALYDWFDFAYPWESFNDIEGIFHNTGIWGGFVALCSIFVFGTGVFLVKRYKIALLLLFVLLIYFVYESTSRAAWVAIMLSVLYFLYAKYKKNIVSIVGILIGFILFSIVCFPKMYHLKAESAMGRTYIWKTSLPVIKEHFLLGTGQGGFQVHYMKRQAAYLQENAMSPFTRIAGEIDNPFNEFIKLTMEYGIGGLIILLILLYYVFHGNFNHTHSAVVFRGMLVGILVFAFFSYPFMYVQFQLLFVMCLAGISYNYTGNLMEARMLRHTAWIITLVFLVLFPILKYYYCSLRWERCVGRTDFSEDEKIEEMGVLYPVLKTNAAYLTYYAYLYSERKDYVNSVSKWKESLRYKVSYRQYISVGRDLERMGEYDEAEAYWKVASFMIPSRFTPIYLQIEMAMKLKKYEKADSLMILFMMKDKKVDSPKLERMNENIVKWKEQIHHGL